MKSEAPTYLWLPGLQSNSMLAAGKKRVLGGGREGTGGGKECHRERGPWASQVRPGARLQCKAHLLSPRLRGPET